MGSSQARRVDAAIPGDVRPLATRLQQEALRLFDTGIGDVPDRQILGFTPQEQADIANLRSALSLPSLPVTQASPFLSSLFTGAAADPAQNPVLQSQIDALTQASQQAFAPQLDEAAALFAGAGASGGSAEANARARMALGATQNLNQAIASLLFGTQQATQQQALQGIPLALALQQDPISRLQTSLGLSGAERTLAQAQQDVGLENALRQVELRQIPFRLAVSALQGVPLAMPQFGPSPLQENLALGTSLAKLAGGTALAASGNPAGFALLGQPAPAQAPKAT